MAHFAELDQNDVVQRVVVVHNNALLNQYLIESEERGIQFCKDHFGEDTIWVQTSYNKNFRKNYASIGFTYDRQRDAFIPPKPNFPSWILNEDTCLWESPIPMPTDPNKFHIWNEETLNWDSEDFPVPQE